MGDFLNHNSFEKKHTINSSKKSLFEEIELVSKNLQYNKNKIKLASLAKPESLTSSFNELDNDQNYHHLDANIHNQSLTQLVDFNNFYKSIYNVIDSNENNILSSIAQDSFDNFDSSSPFIIDHDLNYLKKSSYVSNEYSLCENKLDHSSFSNSYPLFRYTDNNAVLQDVENTYSSFLYFEEYFQTGKNIHNISKNNEDSLKRIRSNFSIINTISSEQYENIIQPKSKDFLLCFDISIDEQPSSILFSSNDYNNC
jgi:hypothetical protein